MLRTILRSSIGKIGLLLLFVLTVGSIIVTLTYPHDFGKQIWNNPTYWADYPKLAAPKWTAWLNPNKTQHQVLISSSPSNTIKIDEGGKIMEYYSTARLSPESDPTFLSFSISGIKFYETSPIITVFLEQGEQRLFLYRYVVPQKGADESSPVVRYANNPFRVQLTSDIVVQRDVTKFLNDLRESGKNEFETVVRVNFSNSQDTAKEIRFIVGGDVFGWLGTDNVGRDITQGILFGLPVALMIGFTVAFFVTLIGASVGAISGYYVGRKIDTLIQRFIDVMTTIPTLPIIIFLIFAFGARLSYVILFLIIFGWTGLAIQLRPWIMQIRESGFIALARAQGYSAPRIIFRHLLSQTLPFLLASFVFMVPIAILSEAGLSFIGLGDPSIPTWGYMLQQGFQTGAIFLGYWWWVLAPGTAIVVTSLAFVLISHPLEEYAEPRLQKR